MTLLERVIDAVRFPFTDKQTDRESLPALYREVFGVSVCPTCPSRFHDAYIELSIWKKNQLKGQPIMSKLKKYAFAQGSSDQQLVISEFGVVDKNTATDEMVEKINKDYPWFSHHFVKADDENAESGFNAEKATKAELIAELERVKAENAKLQPIPSQEESSAKVEYNTADADKDAKVTALDPAPKGEPQRVARTSTVAAEEAKVSEKKPK